MIKLIASDLDGTLANADGSIPAGTFSCIRKLESRKIQFVVATGRQGITVLKHFRPVLDSIYLIADNGAMIYHQGKIVSVTELNHERAIQLINEMERFPNLEAIICCETTAYCMNASEDFRQTVKVYYEELRFIHSTDKIQQPIIKLAVYAADGFTEEQKQWLQSEYGDEFSITVSAAQWIDVGNPKVNKGIALGKIMKECQVAREEAMAFGDYFNDESMLKAVDESYAMETAPEEMKAHAKHIAREGGVLEVIRERIFSE